MKKILMAAAILSSVILISSCGNKGGDPKTALMGFFDAMGKKDIQGARKFCTEESKSMLDMMEMGMNMAKDQKDNKDFEKYNRDKVEFGEPKIEGDKATISVKEKGKDETVNFTLKKEKGDWKVAFDKASMTEMITDKMKESGPAMDSITKGLDELKNLNMDSIKEVMQKGINSMDTVSKLLKEVKTK